MAHKVLSRLLCIFFILVTIPFFTHAKSTSRFEFIKDLQGCKKGENVKDLHKLKSYLHRFGYLNYENSPSQSIHANNDYFDDELDAALKTYQLYYHLKPTGVLDSETATKMAMPRCGVPDIRNSTNHKLAGMKQHHRDGNPNTKNLKTISHYAFFEGDLKWPSDKSHLNYVFYQNISPEFKASIGESFEKWATASQYFTFSEVEDAETADLKIGFERGDHGDGAPFDGEGSILAHAVSPPDGTFHLDADETWVVGAVADAFDVGTVSLHEIGHLLGLDHSDVEDAIMYAVTLPAATKDLNDDDIQGIRTLYNV